MSRRTGERTAPSPGGDRSATSDTPGVGDRFRGKKPVFQFVGVFAVLMGVFYACTFIPALQKNFLPGLQRVNAVVSTAVLNLFGEGAKSATTNITSPRYAINIAHGCDAIEPIALFVAAVLAFPTRFSPKIPGLLVGTVILALLNLVRIVSLFYTGIYWPTAFETMHVDVWQPAFIVLSLFFWVMWALWATRPQPTAAVDAPR